MPMSGLQRDILVDRRQYFIKDVKAPLIRSILNVGRLGYLKSIWNIFLFIRLCMKFPEPTKENTKKHNSLVLLDIFEEFFRWEHNQGRDPLFKALRRVTIGVCEAGNYYSQRLSWFLMKLTMAYLEGRWKPSPSCAPTLYWKDPAVKEAIIEERSRIFASKWVEVSDEEWKRRGIKVVPKDKLIKAFEDGDPERTTKLMQESFKSV